MCSCVTVSSARRRGSVSTASGTKANAQERRPRDQRRRPLRRVHIDRVEPRRRRHQRQVDVFVRDRQTSTTTRENLTVAGGQSTGPVDNEIVHQRERERRRVSRRSAQDLLGPGGDTELDVRRVRARSGGGDDVAGRASVRPAVEGEPRAASGRPRSATPGRYVAFASAATNFVPGDTNGVADVFVRDRQLGATDRASIATKGTQGNASKQRTHDLRRRPLRRVHLERAEPGRRRQQLGDRRLRPGSHRCRRRRERRVQVAAVRRRVAARASVRSSRTMAGRRGVPLGHDEPRCRRHERGRGRLRARPRPRSTTERVSVAVEPGERFE